MHQKVRDPSGTSLHRPHRRPGKGRPLLVYSALYGILPVIPTVDSAGTAKPEPGVPSGGAHGSPTSVRLPSRGKKRLCCGTRSFSRSAPNLLGQSSPPSGCACGPAFLPPSGLPPAPASFASRAVRLADGIMAPAWKLYFLRKMKGMLYGNPTNISSLYGDSATYSFSFLIRRRSR